MTKTLSGSELTGYIKERQVRQVRALQQAHKIQPTLAIIQTTDDPVIVKYIALKQRYGEDLGITVEVHIVDQGVVAELIDQLNKDKHVHGIMMQLPLTDPTETQALVDHIIPAKDVDGLGTKAAYDSATALAIMWLLIGYNIELRGAKIVMVGRGRLVGLPLEKLLQEAGYEVTSVDENTPDIPNITRQADILITATGVPGLITSDMVRPEAAVIDAGVATEGGKLVGDVAPEVRERQDIAITPIVGGVGPLTVCALFDNVIRAAQATQVKA
jgi:methylenetetrahydrofolate dehydrogenase (NADP+)/methenyltetrahydrofolate cyclohydrolase